MSEPLILPLVVPVLESGTDGYSYELRAVRHDPGRASQRPRDRRVGMVGAGYRAVLDGQPAALINLSMSGVQLRGVTRVRPDQPAIVKIGWPQDNLLCTALARVRWVQFEPDPTRSESLYRVGMAFETWDVRELREIMRHLPGAKR
jgi:hypothetical protein